MVIDALHHVWLIWRESLTGGLVVVACVTLGFRLGDQRQAIAVRMVVWWMNRVVRPLLGAKSWLARLAIIAGNNMTMCGLVVLAGVLGQAAWLAVVGLGLGLGMSLRLMMGSGGAGGGETDERILADAVVQEASNSVNDTEHERREPSDFQQAMTQVGLLLNLLEVPAIMLAAGLCLGQGALADRLGFVQAVTAYAIVVLPLLLVSAAGEAMWMSVNPDMLHTAVPDEHDE